MNKYKTVILLMFKSADIDQAKHRLNSQSNKKRCLLFIIKSISYPFLIVAFVYQSNINFHQESIIQLFLANIYPKLPFFILFFVSKRDIALINIIKILIFGKNYKLFSYWIQLKSQYKIMGNSQLDYELYSLMQTFLEAAIFLYEIYTPHFKIAALLLLAYLSFKAGRTTVADPIEQKVHKIQNILQNRSQYTIVLPKKIKTISIAKKTILGLLIAGIIVVLTLQFIHHEIVSKVSLEDVLLGSGTLFSLVIFLWLYEAILKFKLAKGSFNDHHINQKMQQIANMLGVKAEGLLKLFLNKNQMMKSQRRPTGGCFKEKCQEYRKLLKEKQEGISTVVDETLTFQWCSVCKKRIIFDEYLSFQVNAYSKQDLDQGEDVKERNAYLMNEVDRMTKWVKNIGPCNCSRRYWSESTRGIVQFKKREKQIDSRLAMFQAKLPKNDTAYRMSE